MSRKNVKIEKMVGKPLNLKKSSKSPWKWINVGKTF